LGADADPQAVACWVAIGAEAVRQPEVQAVYVQALTEERDQLEALLTAAVAPRRLTAARRRQAAASLLASIQGAYLLGVAAPGVAPSGFAQTMVRTLLSGLGGNS
jgi:TetR/AcrR family transcriptional repressor of bet genes